MTTGNQNPTSNAAPTTSLGSVQSAAETASSFVPSWLDSTFSFALGALTMLGLLLGTQQVLKQRAAKNTQPCSKCKGTGRESAKKQTPQTCDTCGGTGQVEDENEPDVECKHCEGEGEDPCHACKGSGKDSAGNECPSCKGGGKTLTGKKDKEGEDEVADCEVCHGEGELSATVKKMITCDKCNGTGKL